MLEPAMASSQARVGSGSRALLTGGAQGCNVYWQVTSSATLGTNSRFKDTILALTAITLATGAGSGATGSATTGGVLRKSGSSTSNTTRLPVTGAPPWTGAAFIAAAGLLLAGVLLHLAARETEWSQKSTVQNSTEGTMTTQRWPLSVLHLGQRHARGR